ncbi:MAG: cyclic pyranopterin monophosphate synthase MoaC [Gammaproteobacteria bacterium WSBS_2016_MAG_OTU1]
MLAINAQPSRCHCWRKYSDVGGGIYPTSTRWHRRWGDVLATARIAINAAKKNCRMIPLCHSLPLESVAVDFTLDDKQCSVYCRATVATTAKTEGNSANRCKQDY